MNKKRWAIVGIAVLLLVVSGLSSIGLESRTTDGNRNPFTQFLGRGNIQEEVIQPGDATKRILIIPIEGTIDGAELEYSQELTLAAVEQIRSDPTIQAVLLAIDSPGGAVYETREVYDRLMEVREEVPVPVYASMGSLAASGGYYMAMTADEIYASPETITGSIGVILSSYNVEGLLTNLGVESMVIKSGEMKDILSPDRDMTEEESAVLQTFIDESFQSFVDVVVAGRDMPEEEVRQLADGRIYSGTQAVANNLVDELGYQKDALQSLRESYQLENAQVFQLSRMALPFDSWLPSLFGLFNKNQTFDSVKKLVEEMEELQGISLEYRWQGGQ